jgi:hypothetical protein
VTIDGFLEHWSLIEHPFRAEEARQDGLLARMVETSVRQAMENPLRTSRMPRHPDFDKIAGSLNRPSTSVVFGEKGSGKTAIRLQLASSVAGHNAANPTKRVLLVHHDELSPMLSRLHERLRTVKRGKESPVLDSLKQLRLGDHVDAILGQVTPRLVDAAMEHVTVAGSTVAGAGIALGGGGTGSGGNAGTSGGFFAGGDGPASISSADRIDLGAEPRKQLRRLDGDVKRDLLLLQAAYDRPENAGSRTRDLRKALGMGMPSSVVIEDILAFAGWLAPLAVFLVFRRSGAELTDPMWLAVFFAVSGLWLLALGKRAYTERFGIRARGRRLNRHIRVSNRSEWSYMKSLRQLPPPLRPSTFLPSTASEEVRLAMLNRLVRVLRAFGYEHVMVVVDRVDEPPLIQGDSERMKAVVWPLLSNRFLQMESVAFKLLLPIELRHALMRESSAFFQDARLDKQSTIEQLAWTGVALFDLCNQRLNACRPPGSAVEGGLEPLTLTDLFAADVTRDHLLDALEQMRQPRDAFKMLYQCIQEHVMRTVDDPGDPRTYRISKATLDDSRRHHAERLRQLALGVSPM